MAAWPPCRSCDPRHIPARQERRALAQGAARARLHRRGDPDHRVCRSGHRHRGPARRCLGLHPQAFPGAADPQRREALLRALAPAPRELRAQARRGTSGRGRPGAGRRFRRDAAAAHCHRPRGPGEQHGAAAGRIGHGQGPRAAGPFVPVNCAAVSPELIESELFGHAKGAFTGATRARDGLFHYAQGGTLFLDEIAELPLPIQATLLRAIEDLQIRPVGSEQLMPVNLRIMAATNRRLADEVAAGRFRKDLFFRLQVVDLTLSPLRERKDDIAPLVEHFMGQLAPALGVAPLQISEPEMDFLRQYDWPGNVRELRNLVERSLILGSLNVSALYPGDTPRQAAAPGAGPTDLHTLEKRHILAVLDSVQGDKTRAAQLLGVSRRTLERRVAEWNTL